MALVGMVWTGLADQGGGDGGGVRSVNHGDEVCGGSTDCCFEGGHPSFTIGSGTVAYRGRAWDGGDEGYAAFIVYPWGGHWWSQWDVGWDLLGKCPAHRYQRSTHI